MCFLFFKTDVNSLDVFFQEGYDSVRDDDLFFQEGFYSLTDNVFYQDEYDSVTDDVFSQKRYDSLKGDVFFQQGHDSVTGDLFFPGSKASVRGGLIIIISEISFAYVMKLCDTIQTYQRSSCLCVRIFQRKKSCVAKLSNNHIGNQILQGELAEIKMPRESTKA